MYNNRTDNPIFIAVEGPIGAGKTTLAQLISQRYRFHLMREIVEENPFIGKFYDNIEEWSFQTEMFFLCNRFKQLEDLAPVFNQGGSVVSDYHIFKNLIFAGNTLAGSRLEKYQKIYDILVADLPTPNLVIYIKASLPTLLQRIAIRGRSFEKSMSEAYLAKLCEDYERFMAQFRLGHPEIPVLAFDGDDLDFVLRAQDLEHIFKKMDEVLDVEWSL